MKLVVDENIQNILINYLFRSSITSFTVKPAITGGRTYERKKVRTNDRREDRTEGNKEGMKE